MEIWQMIFQKKDTIIELEDTVIETIQNKICRDKRLTKNKQRISDIWDNFKWPSMWAIGVPDSVGTEKILEKIVTESFPNLKKIINIYQRSLSTKYI